MQTNNFSIISEFCEHFFNLCNFEIFFLMELSPFSDFLLLKLKKKANNLGGALDITY